MNRPLKILSLSLALLLTAVVLVPVAAADHDRRGNYRSTYRGDFARVSDLAYRLDDDAYDAYRISELRSYPRLDAAFGRFSNTAERYARVVSDGRHDAGAFNQLANSYYDLRGEFSNYHGPTDLRSAFHRINDSMERLYRINTGRDLYTDDPNRRQVRRPTVNRNNRNRAGRQVVVQPRGRVVDRGAVRRTPPGHARGRGNGHH